MTMFGEGNASFQGGKEEKARLSRAVNDKPAQSPECICACEGAAGILGLCPHMQNPRRSRGIMILSLSRLVLVQIPQFGA